MKLAADFFESVGHKLFAFFSRGTLFQNFTGCLHRRIDARTLRNARPCDDQRNLQRGVVDEDVKESIFPLIILALEDPLTVIPVTAAEALEIVIEFVL